MRERKMGEAGASPYRGVSSSCLLVAMSTPRRFWQLHEMPRDRRVTLPCYWAPRRGRAIKLEAREDPWLGSRGQDTGDSSPAP
jgi:hypothetical protein